MATYDPESSPDREPVDSGAARLVVVVGNPEVEHGRTRLAVEAGGTVTVSNTTAGKETAFAGQIEPAEAAGLVRAVPDVGRAAPDKQLGIPDEARYRFEVERDGRAVETILLWESQLEDTEQGRALMTSLRRIVGEVSDRTVVL
jgi:hypothetical protein